MEFLSAALTSPLNLAAFIAGLVGLVLYASRIPSLQGVFKRVPAIIFLYFVPMICTTLGITPSQSPVYTFASSYVLLASLFLLMVTVDVKAIIRLGPFALMMMVVGTVGIVVGAPIAFLLLKSVLPPDAWQGMAVLSGSWIGGTANMVAIQQMFGISNDVMGPAIVVDTVVGYGWVGLLIFLSAYQEPFDKWVNARTEMMDEIRASAASHRAHQRATSVADLGILIGLALVAAVVGRALGQSMPAVGDPTVISPTTWGILIVVTAGLALSFTRLRRLDDVGGSDLGYLALYFLVATIGAQADLRAILETPYFVLAGAIWLSIHAALLFGAAKLFRAPLSLLAIASTANVGGAASAPVVGGVYHPALAPVGLLLAIAGYVLGIYAGWAAATILSMLGG